MFRAFVIGLLTTLVILYQKTEIPEWNGVFLWFFFMVVLWVWFKNQAAIFHYLHTRFKLNIFEYLLRRSARIFSDNFFGRERSSLKFCTLVSLVWAFLWGCAAGTLILQLHLTVQAQITEDIFNQKVLLQGQLVDLPQESMSRFGKPTQTFLLRVDRVESENSRHTWHWFKPVVRLKWYGNAALFQKHPVKEGQTWQFQVKLKRPHASLNPGGFDYERYLFAQNISATGYIGADHQAICLSDHSTLRQMLHDRLTQWYKGSPTLGLILALVVGDKSALSSQQWSVLRETGTLHLMVISGLHIGIMAALGFWIFAQIWNGIIRASLLSFLHRLPRKIFASWGALLFASSYMALAGFSIPTQRAWFMVLAMVLLVSFRRSFNPWVALALAAFLIVVLHPASVLSEGFWFSFLAVSLIFLVLSQSSVKQQPKWRQAIIVQFWLTLGMIPILAWVFNQVPTYSLMANILAVPYVSFLALPTLFGSIASAYVLPFSIKMGVELNQWLWGGLWDYLEGLSNLTHPGFNTGAIGFSTLVIVYGLLIGLLIWQGSRFRVRTLRAFLIILFFLFWPRESSIPTGTLEVMVLDVGQGEAVVFNTAHHTVVYDTGAKWSERLDGAELAIIPFLKNRALSHIDTLVVSHSDNDHAGGASRLIRTYPVNAYLSGQATRLNAQVNSSEFKPCYAGQNWSYDGVYFEIISPPKHARSSLSDNDSSCVMKVSVGHRSLLITGDATVKIEKQLIQSVHPLRADVLIAGHHGSNTSSDAAFLNIVKPQWVIVSAGFGNRFGFPDPNVILRIEKSGAKWLNTACSGGILIKIQPDTVQVLSQTRKEVSRWYHHACPL